MSRHKLYYVEPKLVRDALHEAMKKAHQIHDLESDLIDLLHKIDQRRFYLRVGFKSLRGYCEALGFTRVQSQRITAAVRRYETAVKIEHGSL